MVQALGKYKIPEDAEILNVFYDANSNSPMLSYVSSARKGAPTKEVTISIYQAGWADFCSKPEDFLCSFEGFGREQYYAFKDQV